MKFIVKTTSLFILIYEVDILTYLLTANKSVSFAFKKFSLRFGNNSYIRFMEHSLDIN